MKRSVLIAAAVVAAVAVFALQLFRSNLSLWDVINPRPRFDVREAIADGRGVTPR